MLNFYYDPILGLQYTYSEVLILFDIESIPNTIDFDTEQWIRFLKETEVQILNVSQTPNFSVIGQITEYKL